MAAPPEGETAETRVLVVEDDPDDARTTFRALRKSGRFAPVHVRSGREALAAAADARTDGHPFVACLLDYRLPDMSGIELCRRLRGLGFAAPLVMLSAVQSDSVAQRAAAAGASEFLVKHLTYADTLEEELARATAGPTLGTGSWGNAAGTGPWGA